MSDIENQQEQQARAEGLVETVSQIEPIQEPVVKTRKGKVYVKKGIDARGRSANPDKTTAYGLPTDPEYFKKYYQEKLAIKIECPDCLLRISKANMKKHKLSAYHIRAINNNSNNNHIEV
jgi:hypothetical protein